MEVKQGMFWLMIHIFKKFSINIVIFSCFVFTSEFSKMLENFKRIIFEEDTSQLSFDFFFENRNNNYINNYDSCQIIINPLKQKFQVKIFDNIIYFDNSVFLQFDFVSHKLFKYNEDPIISNLLQNDLLEIQNYDFRTYKYNEKSKSYYKNYKNGKLNFEYVNFNWNLYYVNNSYKIKLKNISFSKSDEKFFFSVPKDSVLNDKKIKFYNFSN